VATISPIRVAAQSQGVAVAGIGAQLLCERLTDAAGGTNDHRQTACWRVIRDGICDGIRDAVTRHAGCATIIATGDHLGDQAAFLA
jgi:hypothetical protein